jgi:hypothetical protein
MAHNLEFGQICFHYRQKRFRDPVVLSYSTNTIVCRSAEVRLRYANQCYSFGHSPQSVPHWYLQWGGGDLLVVGAYPEHPARRPGRA